MFIKICGITTVGDAHLAATAGANAIGLNFFAESPRSISIETALEIANCLPPFVDAVAVFVNATPARIRATSVATGIRTVQLHGDVTPELIGELAEFRVIAAFPLSDVASVTAIQQFVRACQQHSREPSAILIDSHVPGSFGGTGQPAPWPIARTVVETCRVPIALAGGLTPRNVSEAIRVVRPWGVDVASGVEVAPGRKEAFKVRQFIREARGTS